MGGSVRDEPDPSALEQVGRHAAKSSQIVARATLARTNGVAGLKSLWGEGDEFNLWFC